MWVIGARASLFGWTGKSSTKWENTASQMAEHTSLPLGQKSTAYRVAKTPTEIRECDQSSKKFDVCAGSMPTRARVIHSRSGTKAPMSSAHSYSKAGGFLAMTSHIKLIILVVLGVGLGRTAEAQIERRDFLIPGGSGWLHVREVRDHRNVKPRNLILLHGGGPGGVPSFDLPVAGYSLAEDFVKRGFRVFVMDVRGWGSSTKPHEMDEPPQNSAPLVSTKEAADDIETVVDWVVHRTHEKTALLGWANGGHWACAYSSRGAAALSAVILLNTLYSVNAPWELRPSMQNKENPEQFDHHAGGYRIVDRSGLLRRWDTSIPSADKAEWRDP